MELNFSREYSTLKGGIVDTEKDSVMCTVNANLTNNKVDLIIDSLCCCDGVVNMTVEQIDELISALQQCKQELA